MSRHHPGFLLLGLTAVTAVALSGCVGGIDTTDAVRVDDTVSTINAADLALTAEGIVLEQGFTVDIDCGSDDVPFEVGTTLDCAAFDEVSETSGTYTVTIVSVDGTDYELEVVGSEAQPTPPADSALETAAAFAELTAEAISASLGETPVVDCGSVDIEIFVGQEVRCSYESSSSAGFVISTVTQFDGATYAIEVREE